MKLLTIDEHTFSPDLLTGGFAIDAGCKGWHFSIALRDMGCRVIAMDIDRFSDVPEGIEYLNNGLCADHLINTEAHFFGDGSANFVKGLHGIPGNLPDRPCVTRKVTCVGLSYLLPPLFSSHWQKHGFHTSFDILKLDVEMSEYDILLAMEADPRQITVETHAHVNQKLHDEKWPLVLSKLSQNYEVSFHSKYPAYPSMDTLFIRRDLL